jgi:cytochrome c oxidase subunit 2
MVSPPGRGRPRTDLREEGMRVPRKARLATALFGVAAFVLSACARDDFPQNTLAPQGPEAKRIVHLFQPVFWIAVAVFVVVEGLLLYAAVRFRHRPGRGVPEQVHGNKRLEVAWTIAPAVLLAAISVPTIATIFTLADRPPNALQITVTGHQWWWEAQYPAQPGLAQAVVTANEIHIPTERPVYVTLESVDVIHSFWIPRLAGKQDLEPGRTNHMTVIAPANPLGQTQVEYYGQCAEFCGISHANMRLRVIAMDPASFDQWLAQQAQPAQPPPPDTLAIMKRGGCGGCHTINGVEGFEGADVGPDLTHFASRGTFAGATEDRTDENLRAWLRNPQAVKPGNDMVIPPLSEDDITALIAYLDSLT